jgi:predicted nucleic acid-binding protein
MMRLFLDTSVLIDVLRSRRDRRQLLADLVRHGHTLATSALNIAEVFAGMRPEEEADTRRFLDALECYEISRAAGELAGHLKWEWGRRGRSLTLADTLVAAVCLENAGTLLTDNRKDFPMAELHLYRMPEN